MPDHEELTARHTATLSAFVIRARRQVRLPQAVSEQVDTIAAVQGRRAAEVMREAITLYVQEHQTAQ
ncbi:hypothetical protein ACFWB0_22245 [Rhodococcus sp. NPDC060086]|uniref:hypothetical protein n=1 Tax=Rhodococcus sp. NPDC060086 TaxID=3347055 RepID=UPI00365992DE